MSTDEITYRKKGRAVFLAAIMVLSVVAVSAAFVGSAAANQASFNASDVQPDTVTVEEGDEFDTYSLITNDGDAGGQEEVEFRIGDEVVASETVELDAGESTLVPFQGISTDGFSVGDHTYSVHAGDTSAEGQLTIEEDPDEAELHLSVDRPTDVTEGEEITAAVEVENTGPDAFGGEFDVALSLDGEEVGSETVSGVGAGDSVTVEFSVDSSDYDGDVEWTLTADDVELSQNGSGTITVSEESGEHESGVDQDVYDVISDDDGDLSATEITIAINQLAQGDNEMDGVEYGTTDIVQLINWLVQQ